MISVMCLVGLNYIHNTSSLPRLAEGCLNGVEHFQCWRKSGFQSVAWVPMSWLKESVDVCAPCAGGSWRRAWGFTIDEPHGSLFAYFRIFTSLADDHVIMSHVTGITQPILTFSNQFQSFPIIFTFGWCLTSIANPDWVPRNTAEDLWFGKTVAEDTGMSVYQNSEAASA